MDDLNGAWILDPHESRGGNDRCLWLDNIARQKCRLHSVGLDEEEPMACGKGALRDQFECKAAAVRTLTERPYRDLHLSRPGRHRAKISHIARASRRIVRTTEINRGSSGGDRTHIDEAVLMVPGIHDERAHCPRHVDEARRPKLLWRRDTGARKDVIASESQEHDRESPETAKLGGHVCER